MAPEDLKKNDADAAAALSALADELRQEGPEVSEQVAAPTAEPVLGMLVAAGPRCASAPGSYAAVVESVREGYLLHYDSSRLLGSLDPDLRLLIGDHLYARGIERLVQLEDLIAVRELGDLISLSAFLDAAAEDTSRASAIAWLSACVVIAAGPGDAHERGKAILRESGDPQPLWEAARLGAERAGLSTALAGACEAVGFSASDLG